MHITKVLFAVFCTSFVGALQAGRVHARDAEADIWDEGGVFARDATAEKWEKDEIYVRDTYHNHANNRPSRNIYRRADPIPAGFANQMVC